MTQDEMNEDTRQQNARLVAYFSKQSKAQLVDRAVSTVTYGEKLEIFNNTPNETTKDGFYWVCYPERPNELTIAQLREGYWTVMGCDMEYTLEEFTGTVVRPAL